MSDVSLVTALFRLQYLQLTETLSNTPQPANIRDVFVFFAFPEMPAVRLNPCLASAHI